MMADFSMKRLTRVPIPQILRSRDGGATTERRAPDPGPTSVPQNVRPAGGV